MFVGIFVFLRAEEKEEDTTWQPLIASQLTEVCLLG
jgi:hypothetical protein